MGSYAQCWLGDFYVGSTKNDVDPGLIGLFRRSDKRLISDPNAVVPNHIQHWLNDLEHGDDLPVVYYSAPVPIVRDRLDLMGYTLRTSLEAFEEYLKGERQQLSDRSDQQPVEGNEETRALLNDYYTKTRLLLSGLTAKSWLAGLEEIRSLDLKPNYLGRY